MVSSLTSIAQTMESLRQIHSSNTSVKRIKNGVAERAIRTVSDMTRAMLFHASSRWKDGINSSLWPMANSNAAYIYNHMPDSTTNLVIN
jgi:hypothetical protein